MECHDPDSLYWVFTQVMRFHYYRTHTLLEKIGIYPGQPPLLFVLSKYDGLSQRELAEKLHIKAATITVMLKRMEKANLVERLPDQVDQRISRVYLTDKGKDLIADIKKSLKTVEEECFKDFTIEEQMQLKELLTKMRNNLAKVCDKHTCL